MRLTKKEVKEALDHLEKRRDVYEVNRDKKQVMAEWVARELMKRYLERGWV